MLEFICSIPDWFGWTMVGFFAALCLVMMIKLSCVFIEMWKDHREEKEFWKVHHCEDWEE
jgi:hypothetical protein